MKMQRVLNKYKLEFIGSLIGAASGWCYWYFVGCASGSCAITSSPLNSTIYGIILGALLFGMFKNNKKEQNNNKINE